MGEELDKLQGIPQEPASMVFTQLREAGGQPPNPLQGRGEGS